MEQNHKLTLYISYYLSRFNEEALTNLGYSTWDEAFNDIGTKLNVKKHSVKNWRDEFDPIHGHRVGWYQRPMNPSRINVVHALEDLDEQSIRSLVQDILSGFTTKDDENLKVLLNIISENKINKGTKFILRAPTGRKAEEYFIKYHSKELKPFKGKLIDTRDLGCGYDFEIQGDDTYYIEVKGLANEYGGVLFTNKEWTTAKKLRDKYILALVSGLKNSPNIEFFNDPTSKINPKKNIVTTIQIQWSVSTKELEKLS